MTSTPIANRYHPRNSKCSECSIVSKEVYKSKKYNKLLCLDCLKIKLIKDIK